MEGEIVKVVRSYGIDVDKDALEAALAYDKKQYERGYQNGYYAAKRELEDRIRTQFDWGEEMGK